MNIRDFRYILAVAGERHFGRAAALCNVSQPALSGQIGKLEAHLGVTLFERSNRHVSVTPAGEEIVELARQLIATVDRIELTAAAARDPLSGPLRLGMIPTIGPYLSPLILPAIREQLPKVSVVLAEATTEELEQRLVDGSLDVAVTATTPAHKRLEDRELYMEPFDVVLPAGHALASRESLDISDFLTEELLLLTDGHCLRDQVLDVCHLNPAEATPNTRETSLETIIALVASGEGITMVPRLSRSATGNIDGIACRKTTEPVGRVVRLAYRATFPRRQLLDRLGEVILAQVPVDEIFPAR